MKIKSLITGDVKLKIKQLLCYHMYEDRTLVFRIDEDNNCHISNQCCKCGKEYKCEFK